MQQCANLINLEKCCKTHIFLQKSEPIQPKTSNILLKFCQPTLSDVSAARPRRGQRGDTSPPSRRRSPPGRSRRTSEQMFASVCNFYLQKIIATTTISNLDVIQLMYSFACSEATRFSACFFITERRNVSGKLSAIAKKGVMRGH